MISLSKYLFHAGQKVIDCHVHAFGKNGLLKYEQPIENMICMVENFITPDHINDDLLPYYDEFISAGVNPGQHILCIGKDAKETEEIFKKYKLYFRGLGEVKMFKHFKTITGEEHTYKNDDIFTECLSNGLYNGIPIFIHYDITKDSVGKLEEMLHAISSKQKIVLCHCGMNDLDDQEFAFESALQLQGKHPNLWLEISWSALDYFDKHPLEMTRFENPDRVLVGMDVSRAMEKTDKDVDSLYKKFKKVYYHFNIEQSLNNLFAR